jgi:hypothetical protein
MSDDVVGLLATDARAIRLAMVDITSEVTIGRLNTVSKCQDTTFLLQVKRRFYRAHRTLVKNRPRLVRCYVKVPPSRDAVAASRRGGT